MARIDTAAIHGVPWLEGSSDPSAGMDCAGVVRWGLIELGVCPFDMPAFPGELGEEVTPESVARCSEEWCRLPEGARLRVGDVLVGEGACSDSPVHLLLVVNDSPLEAATTTKGSGVYVRPITGAALRLPAYRWPAAARLVHAPLPEDAP